MNLERHYLDYESHHVNLKTKFMNSNILKCVDLSKSIYINIVYCLLVN